MTTEATRMLAAARSVLLVDWPSSAIPDTLTKAGYTVFAKAGPEPDNFSVRELRDGEIEVRRLGGRPERVDLVYVHRPLAELPGIVAMATALGATAVWYQSGLAGDGTKDPTGCWLPPDAAREARGIVESAGLRYVDDVYLADAVRRSQER